MWQVPPWSEADKMFSYSWWTTRPICTIGNGVGDSLKIRPTCPTFGRCKSNIVGIKCPKIGCAGSLPGHWTNAGGLRSKHFICDVSAESSQSSGDFIPNVTVAATSGLDSIINIVRARRLGLFGHVARFSRDVPSSNVLSNCCASGDGYHLERRSSGRPRTIWLDNISPDTGMSLTDTFFWHKIVRSGGQSLRPVL